MSLGAKQRFFMLDMKRVPRVRVVREHDPVLCVLLGVMLGMAFTLIIVGIAIGSMA